MVADWPNQNVSRDITGKARYIIVNDLDVSLDANHETLNSIIERGDVLKHDQTTTVARHNDLIVKRYNPRSDLHKLKRAFRRSRACRCWAMSYAFNRAGLNVARPLMMYERRVGPIRTDAYFVSENLVGDELLGALPTMHAQQQQQVLNAVRLAFAQMRKHRLTHGDMKASNLLWANDKLFFIDLDAATQHKTKASWQLSHRKDVRRFMKNWKSNQSLIELFGDLEH